MNEKIIQQMTEIVEATMTSFKSDFYKYDKETLQTSDKFPMIWIVGTSHTHLLEVGSYESAFNENERVRYEYIQGQMPYDAYITSDACRCDNFYLITKDEVRPVKRSQCKEIVRDIVIPVVRKWEEKNGKLPKYKPVDVKLHGITLSKLKALVQECRNHGDDSLMRALKRKRTARFGDNHVIDVHYNSRYNEFNFSETCNGQSGLCGCIIFHGWPETGYQENYGIQCSPHYGWASHT